MSTLRKLRSATRLACEALEDRTTPATLEPNFTEAAYVTATGLASATGLAWAPDGSNRLYVAIKTGAVRVIQNGVLQANAFSTDTLYTSSECGLIGMAFDRDYVTNGYIYMFMTVASNQQQIVRYTDTLNNNGTPGNPADDFRQGTNRTILVMNLPTLGANHDGGAVGIGFDNKLYWAIGDNGSGVGVDNDLASLAAKVGRANLDGTVASGNPFIDGPGGNNDYIWARGFRNPFTMMFQETTGQLWVNVVGTSYEQVFKVNAGDHIGYNDYEGNQPAGYLLPEIIYKTGGTDARTITSAVRSGNIVTVNHPAVGAGIAFLQAGSKIVIAGVTDSTFNGTFDILAVNSPTQFTYAQTAVNASSSGGTATTVNLGRAATGGTFLTTTGVPTQYRGNFFFTDYVNGDVYRATVDGTQNVTSVNPFITTFANAMNGVVDAAVGPDGGVYYASAGSTNAIVRSAYTLTSQDLVVTPQYLAFPEGGKTGFSVRLAIAPAANVTVDVAHIAGDTDLSVFSGATLTFTPTNWQTPQAVILAAAEDADTTMDTATFSISSTGLTTQTLEYKAIDSGPQNISVNVTSLTFDEGGGATFGVRLVDPPSGHVTVNVARTAGDTDISVAGGATLHFTPQNYATIQQVSLVAAEDADLANDTATISISAFAATTRIVNVTVTDNDAPAVLNLRLNGTVDPLAAFSTQSRITSLTVNFNGAVTVAPGAFSLSGFDILNNPISVPGGAIAVAGSGTSTITLTFSGAVGVENTSLACGSWQLFIENTLVAATGGTLLMAADYSSPPFYRFFGDADGNNTVNADDLAIFGNAFGGTNATFDFDNNLTINADDFAEFGNRFGLTL